MRTNFNVMLLLAAALPTWAQPKPETLKAFERYMRTAEARIQTEQISTAAFLRQGSLARLRQGEVVIEKLGPTPQEVSGGLIHDWVGTAFLPGVTVAQVLALVQDYDHLAPRYAPEVQVSRLISRTGDDFRISMRLRKHKVITVVLDTEYDVRYGRLDAQHWYSASHSTKIEEVGGGDHGFLWRLHTFWRFVDVGDGVIVQCEAISLTRDIPTGLGWMIGPFVTDIPRESLTFTMDATRRPVAQQYGRSVSHAVSHSDAR